MYRVADEVFLNMAKKEEEENICVIQAFWIFLI